MVISLRAIAMMITLGGFPYSFMRCATVFKSGLWPAAVLDVTEN